LFNGFAAHFAGVGPIVTWNGKIGKTPVGACAA
jgi:hypothetical protein